MLPAIAIADYSVCCALGMHKEQVAKRLFSSASTLSAPPFALPFSTLCGRLPESSTQPLPSLPDSLARYETRQARLAHHALAPLSPVLDRCIARYGRQRIAVVLGSSNAGLDTTEKMFRDDVRSRANADPCSLRNQHSFHAVLELLASATGLQGPMVFVSTACSSSGKAFASAARLLRAGLVDEAFVGGVDALSEMTVRGFRSLGVLSEGPCKPFSSERDGISIGEGAAFFVIEREHDRQAGLRLLGCGEGADAHHMTAPHPRGEGAERVMQQALAQAGLGARDIDLVNAHGTATAQADRLR